MDQLINITREFQRRIDSHGKLHNGSRREVSNQINVQDLEKYDSVVRRIFEAIYVSAKVIMPFR